MVELVTVLLARILIRTILREIANTFRDRPNASAETAARRKLSSVVGKEACAENL